MSKCLVCDRINLIKEGKNPYFVKELETGFIVLFDDQFYEGHTLFLSKVHAHELHELDAEYKQQFLYEMAIVAQAVYKAFNPDKLNYELLGNSYPHLHWHLIPRRKSDPKSETAIWEIPKEQRSKKLSKKKISALKEQLLNYL